jgi:hypothetical protein
MDVDAGAVETCALIEARKFPLHLASFELEGSETLKGRHHVKKFLITAALLAMFTSVAYAALPADEGKPENPGKSQSEHGNANSPAQGCKKERADMGIEAFRAKYGTNPNKMNAFGKCVSAKAKAKAEAEEHEEAVDNAAKQCKKERTDTGVDAFKVKYGTNANKANAFGKCVSAKVKKSEESEDD